MLLAVVLNYCYGTNEDRKPPSPFPGQDPNADCDQLQWHCRMSVSLLSPITSHGRSPCAVVLPLRRPEQTTAAWPLSLRWDIVRGPLMGEHVS